MWLTCRIPSAAPLLPETAKKLAGYIRPKDGSDCKMQAFSLSDLEGLSPHKNGIRSQRAL